MPQRFASPTVLSLSLVGAVLAIACGHGDASGSGPSGTSGAGTSGLATGTGGSMVSDGGSGGKSAGSAGQGNGTGAGAGSPAGGTSAGSDAATGGHGDTGAAAGGTGGSGGTTAAGGRSGPSGGAPAGGEGDGTAGGGVAGTTTGGAGMGDGGDLPGAVPSDGCGMAPPESGRDSIDVDGTTREYILRVPEDYDPTRPYRLIFAWHGMSGSAEQVDKGDPPNTGLDPTGPYFGIQSEADGQAIFVAGQALSGGWTNQNGRDLAFVEAMLDRFEGELCIDESRVFATGFSFGAIMTLTIGCNLGERFRAIAPMSGSLQNGCPAGDQQLGYWASHGTMDTTIPIANGEKARDEFVKRNHCQMDTVPAEPDGCVSYQGCDEGYPVTWCPFDGIHEPPPFSGPAIWSFLAQF